MAGQYEAVSKNKNKWTVFRMLIENELLLVGGAPYQKGPWVRRQHWLYYNKDYVE